VKTRPSPVKGAGLLNGELEKLKAHDFDDVKQPEASRLNPADKVAIAYLTIMICLILFSASRINLWWVFCVGHAILLGLIFLIGRALPASSASGLDHSDSLAGTSAVLHSLGLLVRGWYPVVLIPVTYKELSYLIPLIHPRDFDAALAAIDQHFFHVHPTVWLERFTWPALTEVLQLTYSTYYFLPVVLGLVLWRRGSMQFNFWVFVVVLGFYTSYLGYISVPAIGPRFLPAIVEAQTKPLTGIWLFSTVREMLDRAEGITRDCFPSGHTELTLLVLYYARVFHRKVFWWLLPIGTGVIVSTVYLRYHYVVDVVAGALLAIVIILIARPLYRALRGSV
jgi:membrane-associated phospholipid phosphatase